VRPLVETRIIKVDPLNVDEDALRLCASVIRRGGLVAFPTETVYGLGADAYNPRAVRRIFEAKQRPADNPLIVHIASFDQLYEVAAEIPKRIEGFLRRVWPGPLTVILRRSDRVPDVVTAGLDTVAVRMPAHPVAQKLIEFSGVPIAAPSANLSGRPSPTTAQHVIEDLWGRVDVIIDAGETIFGVESTIIDVLTDPPVLLRPGPYPVEKLRELLGKDIVVPGFARGLGEAEKALSPGVKYRHYAPRTPLILVELEGYGDPKRVADAVRMVVEAEGRGRRVAILASEETAPLYRGLGVRVVVLGPRRDMYRVARNLFKALRELDTMGVDLAVAEGFEERGLGLAVMNRLRKASTRILRL